jgi:hypothetical protein
MTDFYELMKLVWSQIVQADRQPWWIVAAVVAVIAGGVVLRLMRARATKRLRSVLDIYAERQIAVSVRVDPDTARRQAMALDALRRSGLVMGVRR